MAISNRKAIKWKILSGDDSCQQKNMLTFGQEVDQTQAAITTTSNPTPQREAPSFPWIHPQSIFDIPLPHPLRCTPLKLNPCSNDPPPNKNTLFTGESGVPYSIGSTPKKVLISPPPSVLCITSKNFDAPPIRDIVLYSL